MAELQANIMSYVTQIIVAQFLQNRLREAENLKVQSITTLAERYHRGSQIP